MFQKSKFWGFHLTFWSITFAILLTSGLSQSSAIDIVIVRNVLYCVLGALVCLAYVPPQEKAITLPKTLSICLLLLFAYGVGIGSSVLINSSALYLLTDRISNAPLSYLLSGSLNFALVILVWCGFYMNHKNSLKFIDGVEEQKTADVLHSMSSVKPFPRFLALEKRQKISLIPVSSISVIKAAGDYIEVTVDDDTFLKKESISHIETVLDPNQFQRVHRSTIINLHCIKQLESKGRGDYTITLESGEQIACSRTYMSNFKNRDDIAL